MTSGANMQGETYPVSLTCCGRVNSKLKRVTFSSAGSFSLCKPLARQWKKHCKPLAQTGVGARQRSLARTKDFIARQRSFGSNNIVIEIIAFEVGDF